MFAACAGTWPTVIPLYIANPRHIPLSLPLKRRSIMLIQLSCSCISRPRLNKCPDLRGPLGELLLVHRGLKISGRLRSSISLSIMIVFLYRLSLVSKASSCTSFRPAFLHLPACQRLSSSLTRTERRPSLTATVESLAYTTRSSESSPGTLIQRVRRRKAYSPTVDVL